MKELIQAAVAQGWCVPPNTHKAMDCDLAEAIVNKVLAALDEALREPMSCGHPRACWQATKPDSVDAVVGYRCVACEHERLAVAAARRDAAEFIRQHWGDSNMLADEWLKLLSKSDAQSLDAHDAKAAQWMQHKQDCASRIWMGRACDCGLDSFLRRAK